MKREWKLKTLLAKVADKSVLEKLLVLRGITTKKDVKEFLNPLEIKISSPNVFIDMQKAVERLAKAVDNNEKILIYGDFDADGVTSTSLLITLFKELGANVDYFIPSRESEGHGLNTKALVNIMAKINHLLLAVVGIFWAHHTMAAPEATKQDLEKIRHEIQVANQDIQKQKAQQDKIAAQIRQTDKELAKQKAELAKIQDEKQMAVVELERLQQEAMALESRIEAMKGQVARLLDSRYRNRRPEAMIMLLQNKDPNEKGRQLEYLRQIQAANRQALANFARQQNQLQQQSELIQQQMVKIQELN